MRVIDTYLTAEDLYCMCNRITAIFEEQVGYWHSKLVIHVKPGTRVNRTQKFLQKFVNRNKSYGVKIDVEVVTK